MNDLISRADAKKAVRGCKFHAIKGSLQTAPWYEAINEVLEILSALPSAKTSQNLAKPNKELKGSELISRDVVLANIGERLRANGYGNVGLVSELNKLIGYVRNIPSAEAVQGEWTNEEGKPITDKFSVYCSKCKKWSEYRTNYCGHCGARMKGGGDE